jgi:hypothetical protein
LALDGTYEGLKASVADFLNRADLTASIPDFITLAEAQMQRRFVSRLKQGLSLPRRLVTRNASFAVTNGGETIAIPEDFAGPISFQLPASPQNIELAYLDENAFQSEKASQRWVGPPKFYTVVGSVLQIFPVADQAYTGTLVYINRLPAVASSANWVLTDYPDAYLYGALVQSAPYLKDDARITTWGTLFTAAIDDICEADPLPTNKVTARVDPAMTRYRFQFPYTTTTNT